MTTAYTDTAARGTRSATSLARAAWESSHFDPEQAIERLYRALTADAEALKAALPDIVRAHCRALIATEMAADRARAFYAADPNPPHTVSRLRDAIRVTALDFPLPVTGRRLGDATGPEVAEAARYYRQREGDARRKARWLENVAGATGDRIVGEALSLEQVEAMMEAEHA